MIPLGLDLLVEKYASRRQEPVRFRPGSWASRDDPDYALLWDSRLTSPSQRVVGDRVVAAESVELAASSTGADDTAGLRCAFVLAMAWGSGTSGTRSYRHTRSALTDRRLDETLAETARLSRGAEMSQLADAYVRWRADGVGRSFFTKWFRFAGYVEGRDWQPLVLDDRVLRTLSRTLGVTTRGLADSSRWSQRYFAYVDALHQWAEALGVTAGRIEWVLFEHNGQSLEAPPLGAR